MIKNFLFTMSILLSLIICNNLYAQKESEIVNLVDKEWYPYKFEESDGEITLVPKLRSNEYIEFLSNGEFISLEGKTKVKGSWKNISSKKIEISQKSLKNIPQKTIYTIIYSSKSELKLEGKDAGGEILKIYFKTRV